MLSIPKMDTYFGYLTSSKNTFFYKNYINTLTVNSLEEINENKDEKKMKKNFIFSYSKIFANKILEL